jgi:hypothetical protein
MGRPSIDHAVLLHLLLPSARRTLKDADMHGLDDIESRARFSLAENGLTCRKMTRGATLCQETQLGLREPRKNVRQGLTMVDPNFAPTVSENQQTSSWELLPN